MWRSYFTSVNIAYKTKVMVNFAPGGGFPASVHVIATMCDRLVPGSRTTMLGAI